MDTKNLTKKCSQKIAITQKSQQNTQEILITTRFSLIN